MLVSPLFISLAVGLLSAMPARAQSSYFHAVTNLQPAGYWPMHEIEAAVPGNIETNLGTLGALGNGYYADWVPLTGSGNPRILHSKPGAIVGDPDTCAFFTNNSAGSAVPTFLLVPHTSPLLTIKPPFTLEAWVFPTNLTSFGVVIGEGGNAGLNSGPNYDGFQMGFGANELQMQYYTGVGAVANNHTTPANYPLNSWYYCVVTYDGTNTFMYVNTGQAQNKTDTMAPSTWSPLVIGSGKWGSGPTRNFVGGLDEVAIYTNVLGTDRIGQHYNDALSGVVGAYTNSVLSDHPLIYFRMNGPAYTAPSISTWPVLANYGGVAANGVYTPGSVPGALAGASAKGFPLNLSGPRVPALNNLSSFADAGNSGLYNPSGASAVFSVAAMFQGNPADPRVQSICGHGTNSWQLVLNTAGKIVFNAGTGQAAGNAVGDLVSAKVYNDGNWHQVVATHNGTDNALYVDGVLDSANSSAATIAGSALNVMIGSDPSYTNSPNAIGRQFGGQVCEVAFFTNQLQLSDVQTLYSASGVPAYIAQQPVSAALNGGVAFTNTVTASGSPPLIYRWYYNASSNYAGATAMTDSSDGRISGTAASALLFTNLHGSDAGYYYAVVTNSYNMATSTIASLAVSTAPVITNQLPVPYANLFTLFAGRDVPFSIGVAGAATLRYQWYSNGVAMVQATNASLTLSNLQVGPLTNYCIVTNSLGAATSFVWTASVVLAPSAPYPQAVLALNPIGYWRLNEPDDTLNDGNPGAIAHDYVRGNDGVYTHTLLAQTGYSDGVATQHGYTPATEPGLTSAWFGGNGLSGNNCDANGIAGIDFSAPANTSVGFTVEAWAKGTGQSTANSGIASKGYGSNEEFILDTGAANRCYRFVVRTANGTAYNANSTVPANDYVWRHLAGVCDEANGALSLYIDGILAASVSLPVGGGITNGTGPMLIGARPSSATSGNDYQFWGYINDVAVFNYALTAAQVDSQYDAVGISPYFTQQPPSTATASEYTTLTIPAGASGTAPLTLQWWDYSAGQPLEGQTNATLLITNVPGSLDGHAIALRASNNYGTLDSSLVTLSIITGPPKIETDLPAQVSVPLGKPYTYLISVSGPQPYGYQWYFNDGKVPGQTASNYTFTAVSGLYSVVITNPDGMTTSTVSVLTALLPPPTAYATNVLSAFGAVGYWPLQETNPPAPANMETNYGTLGVLGNAYYASTNAANVVFGQTGVLGGDSDTAVTFTGVNGITPASFAFVPRLTPALTLQPPFTWEVWVKPSSTAFGDILAYGAGSGLNGGNWAGFRLSWGGNFQVYADDGTSSTTFTASFSSPNYPANQWHYCVVTYDGTTASVYVDGSSSPVAGTTLAMALDDWTPITIGAGRWQGVPTRGFNGIEDEVAIYTNLLSVADMGTHYNDALFGGPGAYFGDVTNGHPLLYYRMDNPAFTNPSPALYPLALNFGSAPVTGAYRPSIVPGGVSGPPKSGLGTNLVSAPINGVSGCVDAGYDSSFNPTGAQPFSAAVWFKTYPCDSRLQSIMSHGTNWAMNLNGGTGQLVWNLNSAGSVASTGVLNDGDWHLAVGVYDGTYNYLYVDGALDNSAPASGLLASDANANLFLGGNADFVAAGAQSYFGGALAHAAFFTNALTSAQVSLLYNLASALPTISIARSGSQIVITYSGTLLSATNVTDSYLPVVGASPPTYTTSPASSARTFYRTSQ